MGCMVWVSSDFKLKFVSKRSKNDSKKNVGEFFWDLKIALCSNRFFFSRDSRSYMYFQLKKNFFFLVMSTLFQVGWIKKCPFWQYQFYPSWFKPSSGRDVCFLGTLQAAGSIFGGLRRSASQSSHISEGRGAKSIVLNQGLYYIKRPWAYLKAVNNVRFIEQSFIFDT